MKYFVGEREATAAAAASVLFFAKEEDAFFFSPQFHKVTFLEEKRMRGRPERTANVIQIIFQPLANDLRMILSWRMCDFGDRKPSL